MQSTQRGKQWIAGESLRRWLQALEEVDVEIDGAERVAYAAYKGGERELAGRWLNVADTDEPLAVWLEAKLAIWDGDFDRAANYLSNLIYLYPTRNEAEYIDTDRIRGELGIVELGRAEYTEALDMLILGGYWADAAYIAERVLTIPELVTHVETFYMNPLAEQGIDIEQLDRLAGRLRCLLARRLVRAGERVRAERYLPEELRTALVALSSATETFEDETRAAEVRAEAGWAAAWLLRHRGMELLGSELEPDWKFFGGNFTAREMTASRAKIENVPLSDNEKKRVAASRVRTNKRFHYRYLATEMAWKAIELLPDDDPETARRTLRRRSLAHPSRRQSRRSLLQGVGLALSRDRARSGSRPPPLVSEDPRPKVVVVPATRRCRGCRGSSSLADRVSSAARPGRRSTRRWLACRSRRLSSPRPDRSSHRSRRGEVPARRRG